MLDNELLLTYHWHIIWGQVTVSMASKGHYKNESSIVNSVRFQQLENYQRRSLAPVR